MSRHAQPATAPYVEPDVTPSELQEELLRAAMTLTGRPQAKRLLYVCDLPLPPRVTLGKAAGKLIYVVTHPGLRDALEGMGETVVLVPGYQMDRQDKFKLALLGATARGFVEQGDQVIGLVGGAPDTYPDTLLVIDIEDTTVEATLFGEIGGGRVAPSVFDAIVELAVELGIEGWEGHALGTMFIVGDTARVMKTSRQLSLNPFKGYSDDERNLANPRVRDALRAFATLDGAFVVREDGVVMAAGRYLQFETRDSIQIPLGLGARHMAASQVTAATEAIAVVVSQSTGKVRVFRRGITVLELTPSKRRI